MPAMLAKESGYVLVFEEHRCMKRRRTCCIPGINVRMVRQQYLRQANRSRFCRHVQGRFSVVIGSFNFRVPCDQNFHNLFLPIENRRMQRHCTMCVLGVDIGAICQQQLHDFLPTLCRSQVQRSVPIFITRSHIGVKRQKNVGHLTAPVQSREVKWSRPVSLFCQSQRWICFKHRPQRHYVSGCGSVFNRRAMCECTRSQTDHKYD